MITAYGFSRRLAFLFSDGWSGGRENIVLCVYSIPANRECNRAANHLKPELGGVWHKRWIHILYSKTSRLFKDLALAKIMNKYKLGVPQLSRVHRRYFSSFFILLPIHGNWKLQQIKDSFISHTNRANPS